VPHRKDTLNYFNFPGQNLHFVNYNRLNKQYDDFAFDFYLLATKFICFFEVEVHLKVYAEILFHKLLDYP